MTTWPPFLLLKELAARLPMPQAPGWLVQGIQHRLALVLNHVLTQEPEAMRRLQQRRGCVVRLQWRGFFMALQVTPAGLVNVAPQGAVTGLCVQLTQESALDQARNALAGLRPAIRIEGDVQLAGDIDWLAENLHWDIEEDLATIVGDGPARVAASTARRVRAALRKFVAQRASASVAEHMSS